MSSAKTPSLRWMPPVLIVLSVLTAAMLLVALGILLDFLPTWSTELGASDGGAAVTVNKILPICSSLVGFSFIFLIFRRYSRKGGTHLLIWGVGLVFFATGSFTESLHGLFGWNDLAFRFWYLFGAVLIAAWMGQGTVHLLASKKAAFACAAVLVIASLYATVKVMSARLDPILIASAVADVHTVGSHQGSEALVAAAALFQEAARDDDGRISARKLPPVGRAIAEAAIRQGGSLPDATLGSRDTAINLRGSVAGRDVIVGHPQWLERHGVDTAPLPKPAHESSVYVAVDGEAAARLDLRPPIFFSGHVITSPGVRSLTPFFNIFGIITLIGGAIYSSWVFFRQRIMLHRAAGNVLIAGGAIVGGGASAFSRFGMLTYLYLFELLSLLLMFAGFLLATRSADKP
ncbi:MAG: hypothetical protein V3T72_09280 [Thermoanaerobaculia bacterium]